MHLAGAVHKGDLCNIVTLGCAAAAVQQQDMLESLSRVMSGVVSLSEG
jgi:hypothetical protein